jgi:hypothetical protein
VGVIAILFTCLTCGGLACLEIPELCGLQDDTSNDYTYTSSLSASPQARPGDSDEMTTMLRPDLLQQNGDARPVESHPRSFGAAGLTVSVVDLLHFLSIQRT